MTKKFLFLAIILLPFLIFGQEEKQKDSLNGWKTKGKISLQFNQTAFNKEWTGGGTTNFAGNGNLSYDFNYRKDKISWDNKFLAEYGLSKNRDDKYARKTNDRLEFNTILGREIRDTSWNYSFFGNIKTQISKGYEINKDLSQDQPNYRKETTHFMSPGYFQFGPGMLWKKNDNLHVNIAPATSRFTIVDKKFTYVDESIPGALEAYNKNQYFGVDANKTFRYELGASISAYAKFEIMKNIVSENILSLYSNYLEKPKNIDIDYTMNLAMKVNSFISTNVTFQAIYDDDAVRGFQIREVLGVGVAFDF